MARVLFLMPTTTYRASAFLAAAQKLGIEAVIGTDRQQALEAFAPERNLSLDFYDLHEARQAIRDFAARHPLDAIIPVDEETAVLAALGAEAIGLPHNSVDAARATREKHRMRDRLARAGLPSPNFKAVPATTDPKTLAGAIDYPCVLKPDFLSSSRGVIRANTSQEFVRAFQRIRAILQTPDVRKRLRNLDPLILVEAYVPGTEVALEGLFTRGRLKVLALFDKPDPMEGPYFEETIYVTPSRLAGATQRAVAEVVEQGAAALGIHHGPVHAEVRINEQGLWILEMAARSIGGLCSQALRFDDGRSLEEIIIRHAIGEDIEAVQREPQAAGVMMIPIPKAGTLREVRGVEAAVALSAVEDVRITIPLGQAVVPLPEGHRYLGFVFARAETPAAVEQTLREAHTRLEFVIEKKSP